MELTPFWLLFFTGSDAAVLPISQGKFASEFNFTMANESHTHSNSSSLAFAPSITQYLGEDIETFTYAIPDTVRILTIFIDKATPVNDFRYHRVLTSILYNIQHHIDEEGDEVLQPQDNPYIYGISGCRSTTISRTGFGQLLLTYGMMREIIYGLRMVLEAQRLFYVAAYQVWDEHGIVYGEGNIDQGDPLDLE